MEENHIYQFSLLNALMDGVSDTGVPVSKFSEKGNQGLGTFIHMDGELLFLEGKVYQLRADKDVRVAGAEEQIAFGTSANFVPQTTVNVRLEDKTAIDRMLDQFSSRSANLFMTYRIEGMFKTMKCRTVRGQEYKGQPLSELGKNQSVHTYNDVEGTIVGFRSPNSWQGFSVAGNHLHFIDKSRMFGGHVLELDAPEVQMGIAMASNIHVELPTSEEFNDAKLVVDDTGIKDVEG